MKIKNFAMPVLLLAAVNPAFAQSTVVQAVPAVAPAQPQATVLTLPANTELTITPNSEVSSKTMKEGDVFTFSTVYDVIMNGYVVIPKGTRGQGKITWRTGKGAFGKSAKMDLGFEWLEIGGRRVAVEGTHRQEGQGNTAATLGTVLAVGPFAAFVTGKSATVPNGMQLKAFTAESIQFSTSGVAPVPQQAAVLGASGVSQGTTPMVSAVASGDHAQ
ncbi:hypothetical protein [Croceicoccus marinus]|nr:hypothetical protein [Croceicoccus marinus]